MGHAVFFRRTTRATVATVGLVWVVSGCGLGNGVSLDPDEFIATARLRVS